jgi:hypothetical protein
MLDRFCYDEFAELLGILETGRKNLCFSDLRGPETPQSYFILRHDIDLSLSAAMAMARFEAERGTRATYFLLLTSEHYNLLSERSCEVPRQLLAMGHEVGLHYDVRAMNRRGGETLGEQLQYEVDILSGLTGEPIRSIAMHLPSVCGQDPFAGDRRYVNAYDPQFTETIAYYSDSCGAWRDDAYEAFQRCCIPKALQLLIHPFFWSETPGDRRERFNQWVNEKRRRLEKCEREAQEVFCNHAGVLQHESRRERLGPKSGRMRS